MGADGLIASGACSHRDKGLRGAGVGVELSIDLAAQQGGAGEGAEHQEEPNIAVPHAVGLAPVVEHRNGELSDSCGDGAGAVDDACDSADGAVVALDRGVICQVSSHRRGDDVVGPAHEAAHKGQEQQQHHHGQCVHAVGEHQQQRAQHPHEGGDHAGATAPVHVRHPAAHDAAGHHADRVEGGDNVGGGLVEVRGQNHGQLEEHGVVHLYIPRQTEARQGKASQGERKHTT
jgi:hypothetical protein